MDKKLKPSEKSFIQGYCCAVATLIRSHGGGIDAEDVISCIGVKTDKDLIKYGVDALDIEVLSPLLKTIRDREKRKKR